MSARSLEHALVALLLCTAANAALTARAAPATDPLAEARQHDGWVNYAVPLAGDRGPCCYETWRGGKLEGTRGCTLGATQRHGMYGTIDDGKRRVPGPKPALEMFLRFEHGEVQRMLVVGSDCPVDTDHAEVRALEGVTAAASAALLLELATTPRRDLDDEAWYALALHAEVGVDALIGVARDSRRPPAARREALFWLAESEDPRALALIESILTR